MASNPECPRCEQLAHGLELLKHRLDEQAANQRELERELREKEARIEALEKHNAQLEKRVHRSVAPFRRLPHERNADPKPPGRPHGHPGAFRRPPDVPMPTETAPLPHCPRCHGPVEHLHAVEQVIEDLPPVVPVYRRIITYTGHCPRCGMVRSLHPDQVSIATGAAGVQLGPRALALAADLRHGHGLTLRRTCAVLKDHFGLSLTHGGLFQALARIAAKTFADYEGLKQQLRQSEQAHSDETGWWLEGKGAWLWVVANGLTTVYFISRKRDARALATVLGESYAGTLISDCLNVYDRYEAAQKSKCVAHHLRAIAAAREKLPESRFLEQMRRLMGAALKLQRCYERLPKETYERGVFCLERRLTKLLLPRYEEREEEKVAKRFRRQREHLFTFLHHPEVSATNNLAERQLRPAVISRKLSCGNKTERGARTWEVLASLAATYRQRGASFVAFVASRLCLYRVSEGLPPLASG